MKKLCVLILISIMSVSLYANKDIYYGIGVVKTSWDEDITFTNGTAATIKYSELNNKPFIGLWLDKNVAVEFQYINFSDDGNIKANSLGSSLLYNTPLDDGFSVFAKLGFHNWSDDISIGGVTVSNNGNDAIYGFGVNKEISNNVSARLGFEALEFGNTNVSNFGISLIYNGKFNP